MATFYNQATLSYNGNVRSSNITTGNIIEVLSADKHAVQDNYSADNDVVYVISIVNNGNMAYNGIRITDNLGSYTPSDTAPAVVPLTYVPDSVNLYVDGVKQADPTVSDTNPLTIENISVPAGSNAVVIYSARPNQFAPLGTDGSITNNAVISGNNFTDIPVTDTITPKNSADLTISKSLTPTEVAENGAVTYTFVIQNYGNTASLSTDDIVFRDVFTPVLTSLTATYNGTPWVDGTNYTYDTTTGEFVTTAGQIEVPPATFTQDPQTGAWSVQPSVSTLVIKGNLQS
ncbi:MAG: hypothetical protein K2K16_02525 [Ruminococcus sp.]|nr:hypothetical protein [Ruminococcus sp.]MDE6671050.1 hypothetical protein [Ruminococcus sp.]